MMERPSERDQSAENLNWEAVKEAAQKIMGFLKDAVQKVVEIVRSFFEILCVVDWKGLKKYLRRCRRAVLRSQRNQKFLKRKRKHGRV